MPGSQGRVDRRQGRAEDFAVLADQDALEERLVEQSPLQGVARLVGRIWRARLRERTLKAVVDVLGLELSFAKERLGLLLAIAFFATVNVDRLHTWELKRLNPDVRELLERFAGVDWDKVLDLAALLQELLRLEAPKPRRGELLRDEQLFIREIPSSTQMIREGKATAAQRRVYEQVSSLRRT